MSGPGRELSVLGGPFGVNIVSSTLDASSAQSTGGSIVVRGGRVGASAGTALDASGAEGGGSVEVEGINSGAPAAVFFGADSVIRADALDTGNGGRVSLVSRPFGTSGSANSALRAYGTINARGGPNGGNGGEVETSGPFLDVNGIRVSAAAQQGQGGRWLIDPIDLTISNGASTGVSGPPVFTAGAAGANLQDTDIENALNSGTSVTAQTGAGNVVPPESGNLVVTRLTEIVTSAPREVSLTLRAHNNVVLEANAVIRSNTGTGALNVDLDSDRDGTAGGGVVIQPGVQVLTNGGNFRIYGQGDPVNGRAGNRPANTGGPIHGVGIAGARIDTRVNQTAGAVSGSIAIRGAGTFDGNLGAGDGIALAGTSLLASSGSITLDGTAQQGGAGVRVQSSFGPDPALGTEGGNIAVTGVATGSSGTGVTLSSPVIRTVSGGSIELRGRGGFIGVDSDDAAVSTSGGGLGRILISGQSTGSAPGVRISGTSQIGGPSTSGDIVIRATNAGGGDSIALAGATQTSGVVNLRPGGVSTAGALTPADADVIELNGATNVFSLSQAELNTVTASTLVIGGSSQTGGIRVGGPTSFGSNATLQAAGAGSSGITLAGPVSNPGRVVTLSSGGPVTQTAAGTLTAGGLLLQGTATGSNFTLANAGNAVPTFAVDSPFGGNVDFVNSAALTIGTLTGTVIDSATNTPTAVSAANSVSYGDVLVRAGGNLTLGHSISTLASDIELVTPGVFLNPGGSVLSPGGGGTWQVWADSWVGEMRGGLAGTSPFPNLYGCTFPGVCAPGVVIPATGNRFIYVQRPTVTVTADDKARLVGQPNPPFTFTASGLVNGDNFADALSVSLTCAATPDSPAGLYPIQVGATSPVGYSILTMNGTLTVGQVPPLIGQLIPLIGQSIPLDIKPFSESARVTATQETLLYDRNTGTQFVCTPTGPLVVPAETVAGSDALAREWSRVRVRPNLTNCIGIGERGGCDDF
jgi:hypothetical protein